MSIAPLKKVTFFGLLDEKEQVLSDLQELGLRPFIAAQTDFRRIGGFRSFTRHT